MIASLISAVLYIVIIFGLMRLLYGAWPWEWDKTWYVTRQLIRRERMNRAVPEATIPYPEYRAQGVVVLEYSPPAYRDEIIRQIEAELVRHHQDNEAEKKGHSGEWP